MHVKILKSTVLDKSSKTLNVFALDIQSNTILCLIPSYTRGFPIVQSPRSAVTEPMKASTCDNFSPLQSTTSFQPQKMVKVA